MAQGQLAAVVVVHQAFGELAWLEFLLVGLCLAGGLYRFACRETPTHLIQAEKSGGWALRLY